MTAEPTDVAIPFALKPTAFWRRLAGPLVLCGAGAAMAAWTWMAWPDLLVDFGRELYVPWRLTQGEALYRDVAHYNGPLSPYWNALWFGLFGVSLRVLVLVNLAGLALLTALLYGLLCGIAGRFAATVACLLLLGVFAFGQYSGIGNYNFVCPYSHDMTHGMILSVLAVCCMARYDRRSGRGWLVAAGLALGLGFLTRIEAFLPGAAAVLLMLCGSLRGHRPVGSRAAGDAACLAAAMLLPPLVAWALLRQAMPAGQALRGVLGSWTVLWAGAAPAMPYFREGMGIADPVLNLKRMLEWTLGYVAVFLPALAVARVLPADRRSSPILPAVVFLVTGAALVGLWWQAAPLEAARPWPLFALATLCIFFWPRRRDSSNGPERGRRLRAAGFSIFALLLLGKIILNARINHYGFVMAMPAAMLLVAALLTWIPEWIARRGGEPRLFQAVALAVIAAFVVPHLQWTGNWLRQKGVVLGRGADAFRTDARGKPVGQALEFVEQVIGPNETPVVLPEGVMLNYLGRRANPTPYQNFMPTEMAVFGESTILDSLRARPPDWIILVHKDTSEFKARFFGKDYARQIGDWVRANYREVRTIYARPFVDDRFGILILRRR